MFCYGEKESWYTKKVPTGMLPAVELDGRLPPYQCLICHAREDVVYHSIRSLHRCPVRAQWHIDELLAFDEC